MYSSYLESDSVYVSSLIKEVGKREVDCALLRAETGILSLEDAALLLTASADSFSKLLQIAHNCTKIHHKDSIGLIAPLYVSNYCVNDCEVCNYKKSNSEIERKTLNLEEFEKELDSILQIGYPTLELVSGSFGAKDKRYNLFLRMLDIAKENTSFENLAVSINALTQKEYVDFVGERITLIQWQESYDPEAYKRLVGKSENKFDFYKRANAYEEWISAGGKKFGIGILAGISPLFYRDVLMTIAHGKYLEKEYGLSPSIIGIPRIQEAHVNKTETLQKRKSVSDQDLLKMVAVYRLAFPSANIVASTREPPEIVKQILYTGGTFTNHVCSTKVGGYSAILKILTTNISSDEKKKMLEEIQRSKDQQFFHPDPLLEEVEAMMKELELRINFKKKF
jgi:2-iminoacetate synthase